MCWSCPWILLSTMVRSSRRSLKMCPRTDTDCLSLVSTLWLLLIKLGIKTDSCHCWAKTCKYQITTTRGGYQVLATWCRFLLFFQCYPRLCIIGCASKGKTTTQLIWVFIGPHILSIVSPGVTVNCEFILFLELHITTFFFFCSGKDNSRPNLTSCWHQCWKVYLHRGFLEPASPVPDMKILNLILAFILYLSQAFFSLLYYCNSKLSILCMYFNVFGAGWGLLKPLSSSCPKWSCKEVDLGNNRLLLLHYPMAFLLFASISALSLVFHFLYCESMCKWVIFRSKTILGNKIIHCL